MEFTLTQLEQSGLRDLLEVKGSHKFGRKVADFIQDFYLQQVTFYDVPVSYDGVHLTPVQQLDNQLMSVVVWKYFKRVRSECEYVPNEVLLREIERLFAFRDSCDRHLEYYRERDRGSWYSNWRKRRIINRYLRKADMWMTMQDLWSVLIAFYVRNGFGTVEDFNKAVHHLN
ncbi:MAG: hypothetical protein IJZ59_02475 [Alphaproteobacteria bacterium]|nr:hypothetical protein [Alphaproteobacteria bacterium]